MKPSSYKREKIQKEKKKALLLYKQGLSTREVAKVVDKSHNWVAKAVKELSIPLPSRPN